MNEHEEEEFLTQIAAGTDPLTAWAANPSQDRDNDEPDGPPSEDHEGWGCLIAAVIVIIVLLIGQALLK